MWAMRQTKDRLDLLERRRHAGALDEFSVHLVHRRAAPEQQVAAQFQLEHGILIV
jgi:hypothetical protein